MSCWLRNVIYGLLLTAATPWLVWRSWRTGRYRAGWRQKLWGLDRQDLPWDAAQAAPVIWLHGVSVGEIQLLRPLVEQLRRELPAARFAVSSTTDSGLGLARQVFPQEVLVFYFPLDFSWAVRRTLRCLQPQLVVLGELELWPNLIAIAGQQQLPIAVVNGRLSRRSHAGYLRFSWLTRPMFSRLSLVAAQSDDNAARFRDCGATVQTQVTGSLKFDNVNFERQSAEVDRLRKLVGLQPEHRVWVAGSTQNPEELSTCHAWEQLRQEFRSLKLVIVPRHPDRFDEVYQDLVQATQARVVRRSQLNAAISADSWDILLVDTIGELKHWWGLAEIALVGGSFGSRGGQNMLEPAAFGANVAFGPHTSNFRDIVERLLDCEGAVQLSNLSELSSWAATELRQPQPGVARGERARQMIASQQGALQRTVAALRQLLDEPPVHRQRSAA